MLMFRKLYFKLTNMSWLLLTLTTLGLIAFSTIMMPIIEPNTFKTHMDSLWYTMTTMLTVGYGDLFPTTTLGRLFTIFFLYTMGVGLFATFVGKILDSLTLYKKKKEGGELSFDGKNHFVIIDWSHKAQNAIKEILKRDSKAEIVVIDTMEKLPYVDGNIHYVRGEASSVSVLNKANIEKAKAVLIFSDEKIGSQMLSDGKSLMIACAIERIASNVHTTVEVELEEHIENFNHIKVDKFILSNETIAKIIVDSVA